MPLLTKRVILSNKKEFEKIFGSFFISFEIKKKLFADSLLNDVQRILSLHDTPTRRIQMNEFTDRNEIISMFIYI